MTNILVEEALYVEHFVEVKMHLALYTLKNDFSFLGNYYFIT